MGIETKECPKCGKKMIKHFLNIVYPTYPPQYPWKWKCGCGYTEEGGIVRGKTDEEIFIERWKEANKE